MTLTAYDKYGNTTDESGNIDMVFKGPRKSTYSEAGEMKEEELGEQLKAKPKLEEKLEKLQKDKEVVSSYKPPTFKFANNLTNIQKISFLQLLEYFLDNTNSRCKSTKEMPHSNCIRIRACG